MVLELLELWVFEGAPDLRCPHNLILCSIFQSLIRLIHGPDVVLYELCHSPISRSNRLGKESRRLPKESYTVNLRALDDNVLAK